MPNPQELVAIAKAAESGLARMAPNLAEKLVADLPAIFGGRSIKVAEHLAQTPKEALPVAQVAEAYQSNLAKFGLDRDAGINELYAAARTNGIEPTLMSKHNGFRNTSYSSEIALADGSILKNSGSSSRHGAYHTTEFLTPGNETHLSYTFENARHLGRSEKWIIRTPNFTHTTKNGPF